MKLYIAAVHSSIVGTEQTMPWQSRDILLSTGGGGGGGVFLLTPILMITAPPKTPT